jgi:LacI family transcriptional regulator
VDGIIWAVPEVGDNQRWLKEQSQELPVPLMLLTSPPHSDLPSIDYDNYRGGWMATQHLLDQGYRHIGHIAGPLEWLSARQRKHGWQDALEAAGITPMETDWVEGNWSSSSGERAIRQLLDQYPEMDALFSANDQMAIGVLQVACKNGIDVPHELGLVGFDGIAESAYLWPPLTTISQDLYKMGCTAVKELVDIITSRWEGGTEAEPSSLLLQPELVVRGSSVRRKS